MYRKLDVPGHFTALPSILAVDAKSASKDSRHLLKVKPKLIGRSKKCDSKWNKTLIAKAFSAVVPIS